MELSHAEYKFKEIKEKSKYEQEMKNLKLVSIIGEKKPNRSSRNEKSWKLTLKTQQKVRYSQMEN